MKSFLTTLVICFVLCAVFLFFGGALLIENIWGSAALVALLLAALISAYLAQETKIEELEARLKALEEKENPHGQAMTDSTESPSQLR
ncbi:MAG: hypothetical protein Q4E65_00885 [Clostridia bacterium]|nr:hypothetical protein [Clostridia bacterium]